MIKKSLKTFAVLGAVLGAALLVFGCAPDNGTATKEAKQPVTEITITGNDRMRFSPTQFTVRAGETITLTFDNIGRMPKESMGHNLAIIDKSLNANSFAAASIGYPAEAYIAPLYADRVVAATIVLGPGEKDVISFTAPSEPGEYPFVCSFPGHTPAGMKGIMVVIP